MSCAVTVAFSAAAFEHCVERFGQWDVVVTWDELQACAAGVAELADPREQDIRFREAHCYFAERQGLDALDVANRT